MDGHEMPYKRGPGCDICGRRAPLERIVLDPGNKTKLPRAAYICNAHGDPSGAPVRAPMTRMAPGTSRLRPQEEGLL